MTSIIRKLSLHVWKQLFSDIGQLAGFGHGQREVETRQYVAVWWSWEFGDQSVLSESTADEICGQSPRKGDGYTEKLPQLSAVASPWDFAKDCAAHA